MKLSIKMTLIQKILLMKVFAIVWAALALNSGFWLFIYPLAWWDADLMQVFTDYPFVVLMFCLSVIGLVVAEVYVLRNILKVLGGVDVASEKKAVKKKGLQVRTSEDI